MQLGISLWFHFYLLQLFLYLEGVYHLRADAVPVIQDLSEVPSPQHIPDDCLRLVPDHSIVFVK